MILADEIECHIPSSSEADDRVLYCTMSAANSPEIWGLIIDGIAAIATVATVGISLLIATISRRETKLAEAKAGELELQRERTKLIQAYLNELRGVVAEYPNVSDAAVQSYKAALIVIQESGRDHADFYLGGALQDMDDAIMFALSLSSSKMRYVNGRLLKVTADTGNGIKQILVKNIDAWNRLMLAWNYSEAERDTTQERLEELATGLHASIEAHLEEIEL